MMTLRGPLKRRASARPRKRRPLPRVALREHPVLRRRGVRRKPTHARDALERVDRLDDAEHGRGVERTEGRGRGRPRAVRRRWDAAERGDEIRARPRRRRRRFVLGNRRGLAVPRALLETPAAFVEPGPRGVRYRGVVFVGSPRDELFRVEIVLAAVGDGHERLRVLLRRRRAVLPQHVHERPRPRHRPRGAQVRDRGRRARVPGRESPAVPGGGGGGGGRFRRRLRRLPLITRDPPAALLAPPSLPVGGLLRLLPPPVRAVRLVRIVGVFPRFGERSALDRLARAAVHRPRGPRGFRPPRRGAALAPRRPSPHHRVRVRSIIV